MIKEVHFHTSHWNDVPWKFEAGTPPIAQAIALGTAITYLDTLGMDAINKHLHTITEYALTQLTDINGVTIYGPLDLNNRGSVISFNIEGVHSHDVATLLDREGVAIRGGHLCAMPLVTEVLGVPSVCRASFYVYNTTKDVDALVHAISATQEVFA